MKFDVDKIRFESFTYVKGNIDSGDHYVESKIEGYDVAHSIQLAFNFEDLLVKSMIELKITTKTMSKNVFEAQGQFQFDFIFNVENLAELVRVEKNGQVSIQYELENAITSLTYSTTRGILINKLQNTALKDFILPIINPKLLIARKEK